MRNVRFERQWIDGLGDNEAIRFQFDDLVQTSPHAFVIIPQ